MKMFNFFIRQFYFFYIFPFFYGIFYNLSCFVMLYELPFSAAGFKAAINYYYISIFQCGSMSYIYYDRYQST